MPEGLTDALILGGLGVLGAVLGALINVLVDAWCWEPRYRSPWRRPVPPGRARPWWVYLPIVGWWGLREGDPGRRPPAAPAAGRPDEDAFPDPTFIGRWFWLRSMAVEVATAVAVPTLWAFLADGGLVPARDRVPGADLTAPALVDFLLFGTVYFALAVATLIDLEDQTIPDLVTIPGTLAALAIAAAFPSSRLPAYEEGRRLGETVLGHLHAFSPDLFPARYASATGLGVAVAVITLWTFAVLPRRVILRHGLARAVRYFLARLVRGVPEWIVVGIGFAAILGTAAVWLFGRDPAAPTDAWRSYLSAVIGLGAGAGFVWAIRLLGQAALGKEAMGFGDVLLMGMIGTAFGWQVAVMCFFLAPFGALVISVADFLLHGRHHIAFGPYLSVGAVLVTLGWSGVWFGWADRIFAMGSLFVGILLAALVLMTILLLLMRLAKAAFAGRDQAVDGA